MSTAITVIEFFLAITFIIAAVGIALSSVALTKNPTDETITSARLEGFIPMSGTVTDQDSILSALEKVSTKTNNNTNTTVVAANGFGAASGPALTLTVTPSGLLKGNTGTLTSATAIDVTSQALTGYVSGAGTISATDSILEGIQKLNGNITANTTSVTAANGFGAASGPALTLTVTTSGLLKGNAGSLTSATASDVTSQLLTGYVSGAGTLQATDSLLQGVEKLNGNDLVIISALDNYTSQIPLAPPGQRDLWQTAPTSNTGGALLVSSTALGIVLSTGLTPGVAQYSTDGGVTWQACTLDVASSIGLIPGINDTQALLFGESVWTSSDGVHFTKQPTPPSVNWVSNFAHWFASAGLWIMGVNASPTQQITTSPDGITWTLRNSNVDVLAMTDNGTICVAVGQFLAPYFQWSTDGITWTNVGTIVTPSRCVCWSSDKLEFLSVGFGTGHTWQSTDGITWNDRGAGTAPTTISGSGLFWVSKFLRYYAAGSDADNNYSLWSTEDSTIPFVGTHLDGAIVNILNYSGFYLAAYDRFLIGVNSPPFVAYSTTRKDIKSLTDNIRVRNAPVATGQYVSYSDFTINNTASLTPILPTSFNGTLFYQKSQPLGMSFQIRVNMLLTSSAGDTFTLAFLVDGVTKWSHILTIPASSVNLVSFINATAVIRSGNNVSVNSFAQAGIVPQNVFGGLVSYTNNAAHTWSLTGQWGSAASQATIQDILFSNLFRNGP